MFKKRLALLTVAALFSGAVLSGCESPGKNSGSGDNNSQTDDGGKGGEDAKYTVKYFVGTSLYEEVKDVAKGSKIQAPANPTKAEDDDYTYTFDGWYENGATTKWNFETDTVNKNLELFAKFNSEAKQYDLAVWVWGGTSTVYITPEESAELAQRVRALPALADKTIRWKYVNNLTNPFFNQAVNAAHVSLVISGAKMDNDTIDDEDASIALDTEGSKTKIGFGWFNSVNRYVGIPAGLSNTEFALAKPIYDMLKENGPYYFTASIDNSSILLNQTAQVSAKDVDNNPLTEGLTYSVENEQIASVNASGLVTGLAVGTTKVSVHYGFAQREIDIGVTDKEVNLKVAVWAKNGSNDYATQEQIDEAEEGFITFAASKSIEVVSRWDYISGGTSAYADSIGSDVMVVLSGPNVISQCGTTTAYPVINVTFERDRYMGIKPGFESNPIVQLLAEYLCQDSITVHFAAELSAQDQVVTYLGGETLIMPSVTSTSSHIHIGWAVEENATTALFGVDADLGYAQLKDHVDENGELTLYPVFSNKEINLKVAIWAQNGSNEYATQAQIDAADAGFVTFAAARDVEVVSRWDFVSGKTADYPAAIASDVMVIISGKNVVSQCGTLTDYPVIHATFTSQRFLGIVDGFATNPIVQLLAEYLCQDTITVHFAASLGAADQEITVVGGEAVEFPAVTGIPDDKELKGWAIAEDGEVVFGAAATVKFADLDAVDTEKEVTLYPVIDDKPAVVYDLVVDILLGNSSTLNVTEDDVALIRSTFQSALTAAGKGDKLFEIRADYRGNGANFNARTNAAGDVDVVIGASNLSSQTGFEGLLEDTVATNITIAISSSSRYAFALAGAGTRGHGDLAKLFLSAMAPTA